MALVPLQKTLQKTIDIKRELGYPARTSLA